MKRFWTADELAECWQVCETDRELLRRKDAEGQLGPIAQMAFFRLRARFPDHRSD